MRNRSLTTADTLAGHSVPGVAIETNPDANGKTYTTLTYLPESSSAPSQPSPRTPKTAGGATTPWPPARAGSPRRTSTPTPRWREPSIGCTWAQLLAQTGANARGSFSLAITREGRDNEFTGAVDGLEVNGTTYDFEPEGVRVATP